MSELGSAPLYGDLFQDWDRVGARSYYCIGGAAHRAHRTISEALCGVSPAERTINPAAVLSVLAKSYVIGNGTLIVGVERTPWMSRPDGAGGWIRAPLPVHGSKTDTSSARVASLFIEASYADLVRFASDKKQLGILLSGGMDSRVVAGLMKLAQERQDFSGTVVALNWGVKGCRDVVYAERIARMFKWEFVHFPLTPETLHDNIFLAGKLGAEFSPVHLHAMKAISQLEGLDGVLAGSYGDSIGRGEYSGYHVSSLQSLAQHDLNRFALMRTQCELSASRQLEQAVEKANDESRSGFGLAAQEIALQKYYMRRQLNACMDVIAERVPLHQMFTDQKVVGLMWSLDPTCRTDEVYVHALQQLPGSLLDIPWARTGRPFGNTGTPKDHAGAATNYYGKWLRRECRSTVSALIRDGTLERLGVFDTRALAMWRVLWLRLGGKGPHRLDERMAWLASLAVSARIYNVQGLSYTACDSKETWRLVKAAAYGLGYQVARCVLKR